MRSILTPASNVQLPNTNAYGSALVHYPATNGAPANGNPNAMISNNRLDEHDAGFERPPPKGESQLFNPKSPSPTHRRSNTSSNGDCADKEETDRVRGEAVANAILLNQMDGLQVQDPHEGLGSPL